MAGCSTGAPIVKVYHEKPMILYHEKSMILPDVSRVLACLYEKDIKFETHTASYKSLLRLQASTNAPVPFYDGPRFLEESREICRYIAETYEHHGHRYLLGKDALERASIEQWLHHEEHTFNPPSRSLFCHLAFPLDDEEDDDIDLQKRKLEEVLEVYEQRLSDSEFLAGNKFTLADLVHLPNSHYITASDKFVYLYDSRKNVQRWWNAISTRDSWQKVLRDIKKVEQQSKLDELEKQKQQQWQKEHPTKRQQAPVVPSTYDEKLTASAPPRGKVCDDHGTEEPFKKETVDDQKEVPSLLEMEEGAADQSKPSQTILHQHATPPAPIRREVPTSDTHHVIGKVEEVTLDNLPSDDSAMPPVPREEQLSDAPQTIPDKKDMTPSPGTRDSPVSETQLAPAKVHENAPDDYHTDELTTPSVSSEKQGLHVVSAKPHEGPSPDAHGAVVDKETTKPPSGHAEGLKARPDSTPTHGYVGPPTSGDEPAKLPDQGAQSPAPAQATHFEAPLDSASTQDVPADSLGNFNKHGPHSADQETIASTPGKASDSDSQPDSAPGEVTPAAKKIALSDQGSVHSAQQPSPAEPRKEESIVAAVEQKLPTIIGQRDTQGMREAPQHASEKIQEVAPHVDLDKSVPSQEKVSQARHASEPREVLTPHVHGTVGHEQTTTPPASLTRISDPELDSTPARGDVHPTSGIKPGAEPLSATQAPPPLKASMRPSASPDAQHGRPGEAALAEQNFSPSDQDLAHSIQPPSSAEPRNEEIQDSDRSAQPLISAAPDQAKDSQTTTGRQDISSESGTSKSPSSYTQHASGKLQEVAPDDHHIDESIPSQGQVTRAKRASEPREGPNHDVHTAITDEKTRPPSSQAQSSDSKPDSTPNHSDESSTSFLPDQAAQQHEETQAPPPQMDLHDSTSTQDVSPVVALGKDMSLKPPSIDQEAMTPRVASALALDTQPGSGPGEVAPAEQKLALKDQDSAHSAQKSSSSEPTKEQTTVAAPDQAKASQTIFGQQDISSALTKTKDFSSDAQHASLKLQEVTPVDHRIDGSIQSQEQDPHVGHSSAPREGSTPDLHGDIVEEPTAHTTGPTSAPHAKRGTAPGELSPDEKKFEVSDQDSDRYSEPPVSAGSRKEKTNVAAADQTKAEQAVFGHQVITPAPGTSEASGEVLQVGPGDHRSEPHSTVESRKEESIVAEAEQSKMSQQTIGQQDIRHVAGISEFSPDDDRNKESVSSQEQVSHDQHASEPHEGSPPDVHGAFVDMPSQTILHQHATPPAPIRREVPTSDTHHVIGKVEEVTLDNLPSDDSAMPLGHQIITPAPDTRESLLKVQEASHDDFHASELAKPLIVSQEQVSHAGSASEQRTRPAPDVHGSVVDEKMPLPSSQAQNSDNRPDSTPINADTHPTSGNGPPATSSLHNQEAQRPAGTQAPPNEALGGHVFMMARTTSPEPAPDAPQGTALGEVNPAEQKFTPLDQDSTHSTRLPPSIESRKQVSNGAKSDQTNVSEASSSPHAIPSAADLRKPTSSDTTHPPEKILDSTPDDYLTKSVKPLLPMTGTNPVQPPHEASSDLLSYETTAMTLGDQTNTLPNVSLSANQAVGQSESGAGKGMHSEEIVSTYSQKNLEGTSTEEKSKQQQQTDQSSTQSSKDDNIEGNGTVSSNILTASGDIQPSPPKESMEATEESRNQQQADQAVFKSTQDNEKQVEEIEAQDTGIDEPEETSLHENTNQKNNGTSQGGSLDQPGKQVSGVQLLNKNTDNGSKSTKNASSGIQTNNKSEAPASKTEQPNERDLPANSTRSINSQSQADASDKSEEQSSSSIYNKNQNPSKLDGSTNDLKSSDMDDNPPQ